MITSTSHSQARILQGHTNTALREDSHGQPDGPLPASRNQNTAGRHAAADPLPRNLAGAETHLSIPDAKRDQQSYPPETGKVRKNADRKYYQDRHDKLTPGVLTTTTHREAGPNHGSPATETLKDQFGSMNIQNNVSGQGGSHQTIRNSSVLSASTEKARGDALFSSRYANISREVPQLARNDSMNLSTRHETPRRQSRERPRVTYPQGDNEDGDDETSSFESTQGLRRSLPSQQSEYSQSNDQSQRQPERQAVEGSTVQPHTISSHGRRPSTNQRPGLQIINEGKELKVMKTMESNRGKVEVLDHRELSSS